VGEAVITEEASILAPFHVPTIQLLRFEDGLLSCDPMCHKSSFHRMSLVTSEDHVEALGKKVRRNPQIRRLLKEPVE